MGSLEGGHNALHSGPPVKRRERLVIIGGHILNSPYVLQPRMFRTNAWVVQSRGDRVSMKYLAVFVLHKVGSVAVQNAWGACRQRRSVLPGFYPMTACLHTVHGDTLVGQERMKQSDGV